jgi:hypothetical protein
MADDRHLIYGIRIGPSQASKCRPYFNIPYNKSAVLVAYHLFANYRQHDLALRYVYICTWLLNTIFWRSSFISVSPSPPSENLVP